MEDFFKSLLGGGASPPTPQQQTPQQPVAVRREYHERHVDDYQELNGKLERESDYYEREILKKTTEIAKKKAEVGQLKKDAAGKPPTSQVVINARAKGTLLLASIRTLEGDVTRLMNSKMAIESTKQNNSKIKDTKSLADVMAESRDYQRQHMKSLNGDGLMDTLIDTRELSKEIDGLDDVVASFNPNDVAQLHAEMGNAFDAFDIEEYNDGDFLATTNSQPVTTRNNISNTNLATTTVPNTNYPGTRQQRATGVLINTNGKKDDDDDDFFS